jgi:hypothetical protein
VNEKSNTQAGTVAEDWPGYEGGWSGHERTTLREMAKLTFAEKLQWLEDSYALAEKFKQQREPAARD